MKRRIEQLLNGIFEYEPVPLLIRPDEISLCTSPDTVAHGTFYLESEDHRKVRGFLYTSDPRITCSPVEFQGITNEIRYQADCSGLAGGHVLTGEITVCCDHGEFSLPYRIEVQAQEQEEPEFPFSQPEDFAAAAQEDFQNAYRYFGHPAFGRMLKNVRPQLLSLYEGLCVPAPSMERMESFLTDSGAKERLELSVLRQEYEFCDLSEPVRETVRIGRNTWGYAMIQAESDARFLRPEKKQFSTEDFAGSTFDLNFVVDTSLMHSGNNYARLTLKSATQQFCITVKAHKEKIRSAETAKQHRIRRNMTKELEALYVGFRLGKTDITAWVEQSVAVINAYRRAGGNDPFADLFLVQLYYADGKKQKAYKLLESFDNQRYRLNTPQRYAFYLYMTTFFYHETSYVDRVEAEITKMFFRDKKDWKLQWILLYLKEAYLNDENARYEAVAEQFRFGCRSRIMYLEAFQVLQKNPFLMRELGEFELALLRFGAAEGLLTTQIVRQTAGLTKHHPQFDHRLYEILTAGYAQYPSPELVRAVCVLLMKGEKTDSGSFRWYERGVESGLRITGLYEYYMASMEEPDIQKMPQVIRMYFAYDTSLDYRRRAAIYRRITQNRDADVQTYRNYRAAIEKFTYEQLEAGRINEDLAVLYRAFLRKSMMTKQMAEKLAKILCTQEVFCPAQEALRVVVHSAHLRAEQSVPLQDGRALIPLYDPDCVLLIEYADGSRHLAEHVCRIAPVFSDSEMFEWCAQIAGTFSGLVLRICIQCMKEGLMNDRVLLFYREACRMPELSDEFRMQLRREVLQYYTAHVMDESLPAFLEEIPYLEYVRVDKAALITLLAEDGRCTEAFSLLDVYGAEGIGLVQLVRICSRMVLELEFGENAMLTSLCHYCFASGKYDDKLLRYLLLYYEGPVREMKRIWCAAMQFDLDTMLLEEKIMTMILFTRSGTQDSERIFESYLHKMGRRKLCRAYVNLKAYEYFVKGIPVADCIFAYIEREYRYLEERQRLAEQEEVCRLALLQYYAKSVQLQGERRHRAAKLLEEFSAKGMRFAFWQRFDAELLYPYQMAGRVFVEYVCDPKSRVAINYRIRGREDSYTKEDMKNYFEGIFVREFTLFGGEELECCLEEEQDSTVIRSDKRILRAVPLKGGGTSRYEMLDAISGAQAAQDDAALLEELEAYLSTEYLAKEIFTLV